MNVSYNVSGLTEAQAGTLLKQYGRNVLHLNDSRRFFRILLDIGKEPMFLLLVAASALYFILGEVNEGLMMVVALVFIAAISIYQELKSSRAIQALQELTEPRVYVQRDGTLKAISIELLVPGDIIEIEEGEKVPADAEIVHQNDLSINESILTGESFPVYKSLGEKLYQGTVINSGSCMAKVIATGNDTSLGKIGRSIITYAPNKTLLQKQLDVFVKRFALLGFIAFLLIFVINYFHYHDLVKSLLFGLTLAMSVIPEEIPVAFSSFMALGAFYMSRLGIVTRQPQTIENIGAVNVMCLDKTGTITQNKMKVDELYDFESDKVIGINEADAGTVLFYGLLASEKKPFDAMEKAIGEAYQSRISVLPHMEMVHEYPLEGKPPMMTHVYESDGMHIAAAKGAVERIISICHLSLADSKRVIKLAKEMAQKGHRILGVASAIHTDKTFPAEQDQFKWSFKGLISFYDPPKEFIPGVFKKLDEAGIQIKLLTGDFPETVLAIAAKTGLSGANSFVTGERVMAATDKELELLSRDNNLFVRMFPEAKTRVINALIDQGNIVAMTGDGVNDGPALKAANIGIAMGAKGTEVARQAADLIITDDDLQKVTEAVRQGRKIFNNLKKAIHYIISIHIPIILTASLPVLLGWAIPNIFTPIHIIFLELIMGPTCSVFYEREPVEESIMKLPPRESNAWLFTGKEFFIGIIQGLFIASGILLLYYHFMIRGYSLELVRTLVYTTLIIANIFLTFIDRSFTQTILKTIHYKNELALPVLLISIGFLLIIHLQPAIRGLFGMANLSLLHLSVCIITAFISVFWFELYKALATHNKNLDHKHLSY